MLCGILGGGVSSAQPATNAAPSVAVIVSIEPPANHGVRIQRSGAAGLSPASIGQGLDPGDLLSTGTNSRALLRYAGVETLSVGPRTHLLIGAGLGPKRGMTLLRGLLYFFHRGPPDEFEMRSRAVGAIIRGTEFHFEVAEDGTTTLTLYDGDVALINEFGPLHLRGGEAARVVPGQAPARTAFIEANNLLQWRLYYPGVLDVAELHLSTEERGALSASLAAYQSGDLLAALALYPAERQPVSDEEKIYLAAVLLSLGRVDEVEILVNSLARDGEADGRRASLAAALRRVIAAVKHQSIPSTPNPQLPANVSATASLAESYWQQSRSRLEDARAAARRATELAPEFAFGWSRLAELEFSFGRTRAAREAVEKSLQLAPRNAEAMAVRGFLRAADNRIGAALASFDEAIAIDPALGNAWLGRGLCRIRQGHVAEGRNDLQIAATVEPQRALLRSYLGKAFSEAGDQDHAAHELELAKSLDPNDPTAWLYAALLKQQWNRINEALRDLEQSKELNANRSIFRSGQLLDQDRAVRGANLASLYRDAGLFELSVREAASAVTSDYANHSAHLFLADSFNTLRDPNLVNLRFETPALSEYLVANLLAPVGGTLLSPQVSQQEYARLFERDRVGISSATAYASDGTWAQAGSQHGVVGNLGYALDAAWRSRHGHRPNNDLSQFLGSGQFKVQLSPQDSCYFLASYADVRSGDVSQYYDENVASPTLRLKERQEPNLFAGYHREWSPGAHTLFLGARLNDTLLLREPNNLLRTVLVDDAGAVTNQVNPAYGQFGLDYRSEFNAWSAELQQLFQRPQYAFITGARYQTGRAETHSFVSRDPFLFPPIYLDPAADTNVTAHLQRLSLYAYAHWQPVEPLWLIGGVSYDRLRFPENTDFPPINDREDTREQVSPKAGFLWSPGRTTTLRGAYTRSLGGVFYDSSVRLEPAQVAGFIQSYRSLVPESVAGAAPGTRFETFHLGLEQKFPTHTYLVLEAERLRSDATRAVGVFDFRYVPPFVALPSNTEQRIDFEENSFAVTINQLVGAEWAFGTRYRVSRARLDRDFVEIPRSVDPAAKTDERATMHQLNLFAIYQHASGYFAQAGTVWHAQSNRGYAVALPGDDFWQFNVQAGYRFLRRRADIAVGLLNVTDRGYRLNPLNIASDLPRERTLIASFRFNF